MVDKDEHKMSVELMGRLWIMQRQCLGVSQRQWRVEYTGSPRVTEVKQRPARLGFGWVTIQIRTLVMLAIPGPTQAG